ncbi:hypothetical protein AJ88_41730 [Mesorhizobium amorphae CCBAU 01583]|nr:hypothetical protein AJ88_41730 [Mesorhizobium amorphae CCBAU 01583]
MFLRNSGRENRYALFLELLKRRSCGAFRRPPWYVFPTCPDSKSNICRRTSRNRRRSVFGQLLQIDLVQHRADDLVGDVWLGFQQRPHHRARRAAPFGDQHETVGQRGKGLGVDHGAERRQIDDDVFERLLGVLDEAPHAGRGEKLAGVRKLAAQYGRDDRKLRLPIDLADRLPGLAVDDSLHQPLLGFHAEAAAEAGVAQIAVDEQRLGAIGGKQSRQIGRDRRLALAGQQRDHADDLAALPFHDDVEGDLGVAQRLGEHRGGSVDADPHARPFLGGRQAGDLGIGHCIVRIGVLAGLAAADRRQIAEEFEADAIANVLASSEEPFVELVQAAKSGPQQHAKHER